MLESQLFESEIGQLIDHVSTHLLADLTLAIVRLGYTTHIRVLPKSELVVICHDDRSTSVVPSQVVIQLVPSIVKTVLSLLKLNEEHFARAIIILEDEGNWWHDNLGLGDDCFNGRLDDRLDDRIDKSLRIRVDEV